MKCIEDCHLVIKAGKDEQSLQIASVNDESNPVFIDSEYFIGYILVRMLNFNASSASPHHTQDHKALIHNPASSYFKNRSRRYSIVIQGRFKQVWNGDDILFGCELEQPLVRVPMGAGLVIKACKWLDPGIECDAYAEKPYMFSPLLCAINAMQVSSQNDAKNDAVSTCMGKDGSNSSSHSHSVSNNNSNKSPSLFAKLSNKIRSTSATNLISTSELTLPNSKSIPSSPNVKPSTTLGPFQYSNTSVQEDCTPLFKTVEAPSISTYEKRKKYFLNPQHRSDIELTPNEIFAMDFYDAYVDINTANVKLPGVSLSFWKYWQGIPLNFIARTRDGKVTFFCVQLAMEQTTTTTGGNRCSKEDDDEGDEGDEEDGNDRSEVSTSSC